MSFPNTASHFSSNAVHMSRKPAWQTASIGNLSACLTVLSGARLGVHCRPARMTCMQPATGHQTGEGIAMFALIGSFKMSLNNQQIIKWTLAFACLFTVGLSVV